MTQAKPRFSSFEEYLDYDDGTDNRYELIDGELVELPPESEPNDFIANFLFLKLVEAGIPPRLVRPGKCEIQVPVLQKKDAANRYPDLVVFDEVHLPLLQKRLTIKIDMPPPRFVVEVLSPGKANRAASQIPQGSRDLDRKRAQYAQRGIPEYWIIDPQNQAIVVLQLESDQYVEIGQFRDDEQIISPTPQLQLTANQLFLATQD